EVHWTHEDDEHDQLLSALNLAKEYYHYLLTDHEVGQVARDYLKERGITKESITLFQLGYSLPNWDGLVKYLHHKKKYPLELLVKAGLVLQSKGRYYDRFRGRLMFPLRNHRGQVVGFSGRVLEKEVKEAKYINSPETALYHKSKMLFGLSELFQEIRKKREVIVVEGEFDVISSAQAHVNWTVAVKGSALTTDQVKLLERVADRVLLCLDTDAAGVEATKRAIQVLKDSRLELRVLTLPEGKDPDELARKDPSAWREVSKTSRSSYAFLLDMALKMHDPATPEGKRHIMKELGPVIVGIEHAVERDFYIKKLAESLEVREAAIREDLNKIQQKVLRIADKNPAPPTEENDQHKESRQENLERYLLFLWLHDPELFGQRTPQLAEFSWQTPGIRQLIEALRASSLDQLQVVAKSLPDDLQSLLFDIYSEPEYVALAETIDFEAEWNHTWKELQSFQAKQRITAITEELDRLDGKPELTPAEEQRQQELLKEIVLLKRKG
ncbi:MAG TPA: DNA primase, partial [Patescibacteria group bacterium]